MAIKKNLSVGSGLKPVKNIRLHQKIAEQIQQLIKKGKFKHGDQLPPERELMEIFHVSRHSVREAIRTLEERQVLKSVVGSGTYVMLEDESSLANIFSWAIGREKTKLAEIFEFRRVIEPGIAKLSAQNATETQLRELKIIFDRQKKHLGDWEAAISLDHEFHLFLARATGNEVLSKFMERVNDILGETRDEILQSGVRAHCSISGHERILAALIERNPGKAADAMEKHLREVEAVVFKEK